MATTSGFWSSMMYFRRAYLDASPCALRDMTDRGKCSLPRLTTVGGLVWVICSEWESVHGSVLTKDMHTLFTLFGTLSNLCTLFTSGCFLNIMPILPLSWWLSSAHGLRSIFRWCIIPFSQFFLHARSSCLSSAVWSGTMKILVLSKLAEWAFLILEAAFRTAAFCWTDSRMHLTGWWGMFVWRCVVDWPCFLFLCLLCLSGCQKFLDSVLVCHFLSFFLLVVCRVMWLLMVGLCRSPSLGVSRVPYLCRLCLKIQGVLL